MSNGILLCKISTLVCKGGGAQNPIDKLLFAVGERRDLTGLEFHLCVVENHVPPATTNLRVVKACLAKKLLI